MVRAQMNNQEVGGSNPPRQRLTGGVLIFYFCRISDKTTKEEGNMDYITIRGKKYYKTARWELIKEFAGYIVLALAWIAMVYGILLLAPAQWH